MDTEQPMLLALGTDSPMPDFLTDWLCQESAQQKNAIRTGMLDAFIPIPNGHMVVITVPHGDPEQRDRVQEVTIQVPTLLIGFADERAFYPDACVWIDADHLT